MWRHLLDLAKQLSPRPSGPELDDEEIEAEEIEEDDEIEEDEQFARIDAILGPSRKRGFRAQVKVFFDHLQRSLTLPCEVTGIEDFRWEERYVFGAASPSEYKRLKKVRPSYRDRFELLKIEPIGHSEWMLWSGEDIAAHVRRTSDGKEFVLGLAELKTVDEGSVNHDLLHDFSVFFVNYR